MKDERIVRFLNSIGINNVDDFDMCFDMIKRNRFNDKKWDMIVIKDTPWKYDLALQFIEALHNIKYEYSLVFTYREQPSEENVNNLLNDWYQSHYRLPLSLRTSFDKKGFLYINYINEDEKNEFTQIINDFKSFLDFLHYEIVVIQRVVPFVVKTKEELEALEKAATESHEEQIRQEMLEEEKEISDAVDKKIQQAIADTRREYDREKERFRLNKKGNYKPIDLIDAIDTNSGSVSFHAKIVYIDAKDTIAFKKYKFVLRDKAGGCIIANFLNKYVNSDTFSKLKIGQNVLVRGVTSIDKFSNSLVIYGHYIDLEADDVIEKDPAPIPRVELHLHTNLSSQDGMNATDDIFKYAKALGHKCVGITDHGVVQAFPEAEEICGKIKDIRPLYGCEFYMVDNPKFIFNPSDRKVVSSSYVVLDLESTGLSTRYDRIIEFAGFKVENNRVVDSLDILIDPEVALSEKIIDITNITPDMLKGKPNFKGVLDKILSFIGDSILVTHNASFDYNLLDQEVIRNGGSHLTNPVVDTLALAYYLFPLKRSHNLGALCKNYKVEYDKESAHRADYDADVLTKCWLLMIEELTLGNRDLTHSELQNLPISNEVLTHVREYHCVAYCKNKAGLKAMYELITLSHIKYMAGLPKIPRSEIEKRRENLLLGSACLNGEVFRSARYDTEEKLKSAVSFYDYIELQPAANYSTLINLQELDLETLYKYQKDIIKCADELHIPVVATGDVHYLTKDEKIFRDIYIARPVVGGGKHPLKAYDDQYEKYGYFDNPDQHYRTTQEMLDAFEFLGKEKAYEIVVTNTNAIADSLEDMVIIPHKRTFAPKIEGVEGILTNLVHENMHKKYGENPDPEIVERCDNELKKIIGSGYSVVYYYAYKIVKKATDDGYLVGSRGSVGSSFVATLCGITEVNPLRPHYVCKKCHYFEWGNKEHPNIHSGYDLPRKTCPVCGEPLFGDGQDIPFETFLGAENETKVPDIDLNFARDYQSKAHDYTRELLGVDHVFRAGTIGTVAFKTAMGYVKKYITEDRHEDITKYSQAELEYMASGCIGVKKQTGKHAGGVIVVPLENDVNDFTPIQFPADEPTASWYTTHYDYNKMHDMLLKFDLLGQLEPMVIKHCCDLTGIKVEDIPLDDRAVLSLFTTPEALKFNHNYSNQQTGVLGLPEFGTSFVRKIIEKTKPVSFEQLEIIQGLSHGTDVWTGNAEDLIDNKVADINNIIGCRDDIMTYLQRQGLSKDNAFRIMETVRKKDKYLTEQDKELMRANNVPEWYMESADKIKYLFPKAHAAAYTIMALRTGYFKVYYPLQYYAAYLSIKTDKFDVLSMAQGEQTIIEKLESLTKRVNGELSEKDEAIIESLQVALEMVQRGYKFANINIEKSDYNDFVVDEENKSLILPFNAIDGLGDANARSVIEARKDGPFKTIEDLTRRTKLTKTNIDALKSLGVLDGLPDNDNPSLFDW